MESWPGHNQGLSPGSRDRYLTLIVPSFSLHLGEYKLSGNDRICNCNELKSNLQGAELPWPLQATVN